MHDKRLLDIPTLGCVLALVFLIAACDGPPLGDSGTPTGLFIDGPGEMTSPGTVRFFARQRFSDGSTNDVSARALWASSNPSVLAVASGLATAVAPGEVQLTAQFERFASRPLSVRVVPAVPQWDGTYRLTVGGGACGSSTLPLELRERTYTASVQQTKLMLNVQLSNAGRLAGRIFNPEVRFYFTVGLPANILRMPRRAEARPDSNRLVDDGAVRMVPVSFTGTLPEALATDESPFHLSRVRYSGPEPTLVEPFSNGNRLVVSGVAVTTMSASGFTGTLNGSLDLYDHKWSPLAACSSSSHVFTLVRT